MKGAPANLDAERDWLSCVFADPSTLEHAPVPLADFYGRAHALIAGAALAVRARGSDPNLVEVRLELERAGSLARAGGELALVDLTQRPAIPQAALSLAREIRRMARLRALLDVFQRGAAAAHDRDLEGAIAAAAELTLERDAEDEIIPFNELLARGYQAACSGPEERDALRFGTPSIDRDYHPGPGHLVVVAGRPNVGKTSLTFAWHVDCAARGIASGVVSVDDDQAEYGVRGMGALSGINPARIWNERLTAADMQRLVKSCATGAEQYSIHFSHVRSKSIDAIEGVITRMVRVLGCRWVSVDFLTKIRAPGRDQRERTDEALARLGVLASTLEIPIVVLAQLRRLGDRQFREPFLDDLKESGRVEEDAQAAVLLWRKSDKPGEPVLGKLAKVKRTAAGRRFTLRRSSESGLLVESDEQHEEEERDAWDD